MNKYLKFISVFCLFYAGVVGYVVLVHRILWIEPKPLMFMEAAVYMLVMCALFINREIRDYISGLPRRFLVFLMALIFLCGGAQYMFRDIATFPFVPWTMYSRPMNSGVISVYMVVGEDVNGNRHEIDPKKLMKVFAHGTFRADIQNNSRILQAMNDPAVEHSGFVYRTLPESLPENGSMQTQVLNVVRRAYAKRKGVTVQEFHRQTDDLLRTLGKRFTEENPHIKLARVMLYKRTADIYQPYDQPVISKVIWTTPYEDQ